MRDAALEPMSSRCLHRMRRHALGEQVSADIAVVDDEPAVLQMIQDFLQIEGYSSVGADATSIGGLIAAGEKPRLFLIDLMLGETSGIEVAQRLHDAGFGDVPMLAVSASRAFLQMASASGLFQDVVYKPFDLADLRGRIERHLGVPGTAWRGG
ncbi:MAG TPA: response regulator [Chloroflexota bacterium]